MIKKIQHIIATKYFEYFLLTVILCSAFLLRLYKINSPVADWHSWRQADTISVTKIYVEDGIDLLVPRFYDISSIQSGIHNPNGFRMVEFPIYNAVTAWTYNLYPNISLEIWSRLVIIFSAILSGLFIFLIGKRFLGKWGGLLSVFFYLFIPFNIYFTRVILPDPVGVLFGIVGLYFFIRFYDNGGGLYLFLSAILFALMLLIKPYLGFYLFPAIYLVFNKYGYKKMFYSRDFLVKEILFLFLVFTPFLVWRWWESNFPSGIPFFGWAFNGSGIRFHPAYWYWIFAERLGGLILGAMGLIPFAMGVLSLEKKLQRPAMGFLYSFIVGALFYVVVVASANVMHDYYQILIIPPISLILAAGTLYMWEQTVFNKTLTRVVLVFCIGIMLIAGWYKIKGNYAINHSEIIDAGKKVQELTPSDAKIVATYNGDTAFLYQTNRYGWPAVDDSIDNIIKKGASYYVSVDLGSADTKNFEKHFTTIYKTDKYIILDLLKEINQK